jgi:hypothetical protein
VLWGRVVPPIDFDKLSFCESVTASGRSPWHLRELTDVGKKLGGGIDTASFCEIVRPTKAGLGGWDIDVPVTLEECDRLIRVQPCGLCPRCYGAVLHKLGHRIEEP